jgi:hypothetical protein
MSFSLSLSLSLFWHIYDSLVMPVENVLEVLFKTLSPIIASSPTTNWVVLYEH